MTAEVAVLNSNGIALAADSAVTIGHEEGKIYTSADKLFQLSECAPVGIMVYGSASFLGVPWETIIKSYRTELGGRTFSKTLCLLKGLHLIFENIKNVPSNKTEK